MMFYLFFGLFVNFMLTQGICNFALSLRVKICDSLNFAQIKFNMADSSFERKGRPIIESWAKRLIKKSEKCQQREVGLGRG